MKWFILVVLVLLVSQQAIGWSCKVRDHDVNVVGATLRIDGVAYQAGVRIDGIRFALVAGGARFLAETPVGTMDVMSLDMKPKREPDGVLGKRGVSYWLEMVGKEYLIIVRIEKKSVMIKGTRIDAIQEFMVSVVDSWKERKEK